MTSATAIGASALVGFGVVAAISVPIGVNLAASKTLAAPVLTSRPASATSSTAATFAWTGPSGATFQCALDSTPFAACTSPKTYLSVAVSAHTFQVKSISGSEQSTATVYAWTVDQTPPPAPTFASTPAAYSNTTSPSFTFADMEPGVSFQCKLDFASAFTACSSPQMFTGLAPGTHSLTVKAVDPAGNVSTTAASYDWTVDTAPPPAPAITAKPNDPAVGATRSFSFTDTEDGVRFQCAGENGVFAACTSPYSYVVDTNNSGQHQFAVRALDTAGNVSGATSYSFKVAKDTATTGTPFQISGSVNGLTLGAWKPLAVHVTNPNNVPIYVTALAYEVSADSVPTGCASATNVEKQQSNISTTIRLVVPANGSVDLPAQGVTAPLIRLKNLATNQDFCKARSFTLSFTGTASN